MPISRLRRSEFGIRPDLSLLMFIGTARRVRARRASARRQLKENSHRFLYRHDFTFCPTSYRLPAISPPKARRKRRFD